MGRSKALIEKALRMDGLSYYARVTTFTNATHFKANDLAGWGDDYFNDWHVYVARDAGGAGAAPQNESQRISNYTSSDGTFTHDAFTTPLAVGDEILIIHHDIGSITAPIDMLSRPSICLYEGWQDEAGIDTTVWTVTDPATGAAWSRGASGAYLRATAAPNAIETARLVSDQRWIAAPDTYGTNTILRKLVLEFELKLANVANLDETLTFLGLTTGAADNRSTDNIIGWGINTDVLESITDVGSAETTNTTFGETLTNWNKLKIEVYSGHVKFYINESEVADHTTNLPDYPFYLNFFLDTDGAGGASTIEIGIVRVWYEDIFR